jgi:hypothetical protein
VKVKMEESLPLVCFAPESGQHGIAQSARRVRAAVKRSIDGDDESLDSKVYGDPWKSPKDGNQMVDPNSKWTRITFKRCGTKNSSGSARIDPHLRGTSPPFVPSNRSCLHSLRGVRSRPGKPLEAR